MGNNLEQEEQSFWQRNRDKILVVCGLVITIIGGYLVYKNWDSIHTHGFLKTLSDSCNSINGGKRVVVEKKSPLILPETIFSEEIDASHRSLASADVKTVINGGDPFPVTRHVRNMADSKTASLKQRELAESLGIVLGDHQTYVRDFYKKCSSLM